MNKKACLELVKEEFRFLLQTDNEAEIVCDKLIEEYENSNRNEGFEVFVTDSVCMFDCKEDAFEWFVSFSISCLALLDILDTQNLKVTQDMVGKDFSDAIIDCYLDSQENYMKINDHIYLAWWM